MQKFSTQGTNEPDPANDAFQNWLIEVCTGSLTQSEREQALIEWQAAPSARYCLPDESDYALTIRDSFTDIDYQYCILRNDHISAVSFRPTGCISTNGRNLLVWPEISRYRSNTKRRHYD
jgi:hypothetical protein